MNFRNGAAVFTSTAGAYVLFPLGGSHKMLVNNEVINIVSPTVEFSNHRYETPNAKIAKAMISSHKFNRDPFYFLDVSCLPEELKEYWGMCTPSVKRELCLALVDGKSAEEAFDLIPAEQMIEAAPTERDKLDQLIVYCPVPGCGKQARGKFAGAAMVNHKNEDHPGWKESE